MAKRAVIDSEGEYPPFRVSRHENGKSWIISGERDDIAALKVNGEWCSVQGEWGYIVGPVVFKKKAAPAISRLHEKYLKEIPLKEELSRMVLPEISGLTFEKLKEPMVRVSGKDILTYKSFISFRSAPCRLNRSAYDKKHSWVVKLQDFDELAEKLKATELLVKHAKARRFTHVRDMQCFLDGEGSYAAHGQIVHLFQWTFPNKHPALTWSGHYGGVWRFSMSDADEVDDWFASLEGVIRKAEDAFMASEGPKHAQPLISMYEATMCAKAISIRLEGLWLKVKIPYIEGLNDYLIRRHWCWVPSTKEWCIRLDENFDIAVDDIPYLRYLAETRYPVLSS